MNIIYITFPQPAKIKVWFTLKILWQKYY